ncbi:MAG: hypothetical protein Q8O82_18890 [Pseudorhodobacter sp.]|nr:hypothetical protein [Pseudorhodobacter sp.]
MGEIAEFERRITAALERIGTGLDRLSASAASAEVVEVVAAAVFESDADDDLASLRDALEQEKNANAQLAKRLRALKGRDVQAVSEAKARIEAMTRQLDVQGLELQRMRKTTIQLREQLRSLREAQTEGLAEPHMINKAMLAELEALHATRASETAEMDEILAELTPLLQEVGEDA